MNGLRIGDFIFRIGVTMFPHWSCCVSALEILFSALEIIFSNAENNVMQIGWLGLPGCLCEELFV
ncbi:MAG: hypothetical protein H6660_07230 [Ardenticatenaceae bacterium]|nr:hypothetical protein [Ardenticatenaceae bacterium]